MNATPADAEILLLGASGFLGPALRRAFAPGEMLATHHRNAFDGSTYFDARESRVADLIRGATRRPRAAVLSFAITSLDACARDPAGTAKVNVEAAIRVVDECWMLGITPVFTSSDAVFDGSRAMWREDDAAEPILEYGRQKREIERYLAASTQPWLVVRLPRLLSPDGDSRCMLTGWCRALGRPDRIYCALDQFFTPAGADDVAGAIATLVREGAQGRFHLGGPLRLSRRALLEAVLLEYRCHFPVRAEVVECSLHDLAFAEKRPLDTSLDSSRYASRHHAAFRDPRDIARSTVLAYASRIDDAG